MKIECLIKREGGSFIGVGGVEYHFAPQPDGKHVAEVKDKDHAKILLAITEGYRLVDAPSLIPESDEETSPEDSEPKKVVRRGKRQ